MTTIAMVSSASVKPRCVRMPWPSAESRGFGSEGQFTRAQKTVTGTGCTPVPRAVMLQVALTGEVPGVGTAAQVVGEPARV